MRALAMGVGVGLGLAMGVDWEEAESRGGKEPKDARWKESGNLFPDETPDTDRCNATETAHFQTLTKMMIPPLLMAVLYLTQLTQTTEPWPWDHILTPPSSTRICPFLLHRTSARVTWRRQNKIPPLPFNHVSSQHNCQCTQETQQHHHLALTLVPCQRPARLGGASARHHGRGYLADARSLPGQRKLDFFFFRIVYQVAVICRFALLGTQKKREAAVARTKSRPFGRAFRHCPRAHATTGTPPEGLVHSGPKSKPNSGPNGEFVNLGVCELITSIERGELHFYMSR